MGMLQNTVVAGLLASFIIAIFLIPIGTVNEHYSGGISTTNLSSLNRLNDLSAASDDLRDQATKQSSVDTEESEASFLSNAFVFGKFVLTGGPLSIITSMLGDFVRIAHIPWEVYIFLSAVLGVVLSIALIKSITGRGG